MKNSKSEKSKNVRGFYTALGISALMIGSACYFSYKEGDSKKPDISSDSISSSSQYAVDRKETNIPKATTNRYGGSYIIVTTTASSVTEPQTEYSETVTEETKEANVIYNYTEETIPPTEPVSEISETPEILNQPLKSPLVVINEFSGQELVKNETTGSWQTHNGTDYKAQIGDDVYSVTDGDVTAVNNDPLWGITVIIKAENGDIYRYCNLSKELTIQNGIRVSAGDVIGSVGDTADIESAVEPHLHIEVMRGGKYQNPADFIKSE